jgi:eukaryotic-like serine/threonine-protein kinase
MLLNCWIVDFGEARIIWGLSSTTLPHIAMELVRGEPLSAIIAREGAMGVDRAASIVAQAAAALNAPRTNRGSCIVTSSRPTSG